MACCPPNSMNDVTDDVKQYYGNALKSVDDLKTAACTTPAQNMPKHIRDVISTIHDEVIIKYYGCGLVVPDCLEDMKILDLGSGSGRDCYALSKLVGQNGFVTGIDMTDEQLEVANRHIDYQTNAFGYEKPNIKFVKGYIEKLQDAGIKDESIDIIISNCVINLCKDKREVLKEAFRVLRYGGELYFSDVYADRELSDDVRNHKVLWGECVSGALYWKQLFDLAREIGFETPRTFSAIRSPLDVTKPGIKEVVGEAKFASVLYRLFKLPGDTDRSACQVIYNGTVTACEREMKFDHNLTFKEGEPMTVDGSTCAILKQSRFKDDFMFKKSSSCVKINEPIVENPFDLIGSDDVINDVSTSCCGGGSCC